jgi:hypothetical protein
MVPTVPTTMGGSDPVQWPGAGAGEAGVGVPGAGPPPPGAGVAADFGEGVFEAPPEDAAAGVLAPAAVLGAGAALGVGVAPGVGVAAELGAGVAADSPVLVAGLDASPPVGAEP